MTKRRQHQGEKQQGAILFISLIILLLMTIVAVGSVQLSTIGAADINDLSAAKYLFSGGRKRT